MRLINLEKLENQKLQAKKKIKHWLLKTQLDFLKEEKKFLMGLKAKWVPIAKKTHKKGLKILAHKQMLQRFLIAVAQVKAGNASEKSLNETHEIINSLYQVFFVFVSCIFVFFASNNLFFVFFISFLFALLFFL